MGNRFAVQKFSLPVADEADPSRDAGLTRGFKSGSRLLRAIERLEEHEIGARVLEGLNRFAVFGVHLFEAGRHVGPEAPIERRHGAGDQDIAASHLIARFQYPLHALPD